MPFALFAIRICKESEGEVGVSFLVGISFCRVPSIPRDPSGTRKTRVPRGTRNPRSTRKTRVPSGTRNPRSTRKTSIPTIPTSSKGHCATAAPTFLVAFSLPLATS